MPNERDMYYNTYGYSSILPSPMMNNQNQLPYMNQNNELESRLNRIERQIKRLDQRISRLENPNGYNDTDNSMYMM